MAHKPFVSITSAWLDLTTAITDYNAEKSYNIQNLANCPVWFCVKSDAPINSDSYTIANHEDIVVIPSSVVGVWVKCIGETGGKLSIEEA